MCLLTFSWQPQQQQLIVAANRDEFFNRPTQAMAEWPEHPGVFAGKDLDQGGSWMGVTASKRFAALTNIRAPGNDPDNPKSRGHLVMDFLTSKLSPEAFMRQLANDARQYGLFNLICSDGEQLWYAHNHPDYRSQKLEAGLYGLSNAHLDTPWPKTELAKKQLQQWLAEEHGETLPSRLLNRREPFPQDQLPATGVPAIWEKLLSSQFIHSPAYGTRCSTAIAINQNAIDMEEISWDQNGDCNHKFRHQIPA